MHLLIEAAAVFGLEDPVPGIRPYQQPARHMHALQRAPVLQRVADRHPVVALADAEQHRRFPLGRVGYRTLIAPDCVAAPGRPAIRELAAVNPIALAPLRREIDLAGVADDAAVACRRGLEPVDQVAAIAGARRAHARSVDERIALERLV